MAEVWVRSEDALRAFNARQRGTGRGVRRADVWAAAFVAGRNAGRGELYARMAQLDVEHRAAVELVAAQRRGSRIDATAGVLRALSAAAARWLAAVEAAS